MNVKIKELPESLTLNGADVFPIDRSDNLTAKVSIDTFKQYIVNYLSQYYADNNTIALDPTTNTFSVKTVFLPLSGGIMTGPLTLNAAPSEPLHPANKQYVDTRVDTVAAEVALTYVRKDGDTMSGPLKVDSTVIIQNLLYANGGANIINDVTVGGNLTVSQDLTVNTALNARQALNVTGDAMFGSTVNLQNNKLLHFTTNVKAITLGNAPNNVYTLVPNDNGAVLIISGSDTVCRVICPLGLPVGFNVMLVQNSNSTVYVLPELDGGGNAITEVVHIDDNFSIRTRYGVCNVLLITASRFLIAGDLA